MGRPATTHCLRGHERTEENTRVDPTGARACRDCDAIRQREKRERVDTYIATLEDEVAELKELTALYEAEPKSSKLSQLWGEQTARVLALKHAAVPKVEWVRPGPPPPFLDNSQWADRLPAVCPLCEGWLVNGRDQTEPLRTHGYTIRIGNLQAECNLCHGIYEVGEENV